jgi:hypothetical protein
MKRPFRQLLLYGLVLATIQSVYVLLRDSRSVVFQHLDSHHDFLPPVDFSVSNQAQSGPSLLNILYTVFAGRKDRLLLQEPYWVEMIRIGAITEVHLWDYTRGGLHNPDRKHLQHLARKYSSFLTIMDPFNIDMNETYWHDLNTTLKEAIEVGDNGRARLSNGALRGYSEYYKYYAKNPYNGIIIKADDDIVWINSTMVRPYAEFLWNHSDIFLLSASVVNQGLCAYYQQLHGAIPRSYLHLPFASNGMGQIIANGTEALKLHKHFLSSETVRRRFFITNPEYIQFNYTINVNFVALRGHAFGQVWELILDKLEQRGRYYDEGTLTWDAIRKRQKTEGIYMPLVVSHAAYSHQRESDKEIMKLYTDWVIQELPDFYRGILPEVPVGKEQRHIDATKTQ